MKTRRRTGPSARACNSAGQIPCLDAHQGAVPCSDHFQLSSILLPLGPCRLWTPRSFQHVPHVQAPRVAALWIWDFSASSYSPGPTSSHCLGNLHPPIQTRTSRTRDPYCSHPWAANTKRDNCPFFQAWRTWEAALAAKPAFPKALHDATVL